MPNDGKRRSSLFGGLGKLIGSGNSTHVTTADSENASSNGGISTTAAAPTQNVARRQSASSGGNSTDDLPVRAKDQLFAYQLDEPDPRRLGPECFHHVGIALNRALSGRMHAALCRAAILSPHAEDWRVYTDRVGRGLPGQVPFVSVPDLRRTVSALFFWEEEIVRWNLIGDQIAAEKAAFKRDEAKVARVEASGANVADSDEAYERHARLERHRLAVAQLEAGRRLLPSARDGPPRDGDEDENGRPAFRPPAYGDTRHTLSVLGSPSREDVRLELPRPAERRRDPGASAVNPSPGPATAGQASTAITTEKGPAPH